MIFYRNLLDELTTNDQMHGAISCTNGWRR
jgi:hypothetical protein